MNIWEFCIRRPVFTVMLVCAPIVLGAAAYGRLGVDLFPNVDIPSVVVTTTLRGASVEEMETGVTKVIEEAVNTISGIDELRSTTKEGFSQARRSRRFSTSFPSAPIHRWSTSCKSTRRRS
jgi:HAE1 family hydrophobic/amphiphilic exporter-1